MFEEFTNQYQLSKTLRFELIPQGKTLEHIENKGLLAQDEERAESYKKMKKTIDGFHKHFIEIAMRQVRLTHLKTFYDLYNASPEKKKEDSFKKELAKVSADLRKEIVDGFKTGDAGVIFSKIDKKELITDLLEKWIDVQQEQDVYFDKSFKTFTTYFVGFHENRKNMYTDKEQSTAIAYRLIHENLPKFLDNIKIFKDITEKFDAAKIKEIETKLESVIQGTPLSEIFTLDYYNNVLTQNGIDFINNIIGGYTEEEGKNKIQGLYEYINLYNQKQDKKNRIPKLKQLYKQILSDRESISFLPEAFEDDPDETASQKVLNAIENYYKANLIDYKPDDKDETENVLKKIKELLASIHDYDLKKIYLRNDNKLSGISQKLFGSYAVFGDALMQYFETTLYPQLRTHHQIKLDEYKSFTEEQKKEHKKPNLGSLDKEQEKFRKQAFYSVSEIQNAVDNYIETLDEDHEHKKAYSPNCIADYFHTRFIAEEKDNKEKTFELLANIEAKYSCIQGILNTDYPKDKRLHQDKKTILDIKAFLDALMELLHFVKPLSLPSDSVLEKAENFYSYFDTWYRQLQSLIPLYNKVRNYAAQKPYSTEKFKLNFENKAKFLDGWVDSLTENSDNATQAGGYLFRKKNAIDEYDYFVGFSSDVKLFRSHLQNEIEDNDKCEYERLDYYQLKSASVYGNSYVGESYEKDKKKLFKAIYTFARSSNSPTLVTDFDNYRNRQSGDNQPTPSGLIKIVGEKYPDLYKNLLLDEGFEKVNSEVTKNLKDTILSLRRVPQSKTYKDKCFNVFTEPMKVIEELSGKKSFSYFPVNKNEFETAYNRSEKPLFLFKITNKDLSFAETFGAGKRKKRGKDNLHTMYFKALMSEKQSVYDIGSGMVFYRKKSLDYNENTFKKGHHYEELKDKFDYPIISNRRFAFDKFQFHLSIVQNYQAPKKPPKDYNQKVLDYLKNNPDVNIIGIDRGERHLIYITLINQQGEIKQQFSLNEIVNSYKSKSGEEIEVRTPYHTLLDKREDERDKARKSWGTIENIKELKEGYISQVVHKIAQMMVEHNAIVVMEDLNFGFKRGRFKVEKQVYQKLEKRLIDKLNYLVFKDNQPDEPGSLYKALQLTNEFKSFQKLGKQSGFLFYVPAWNTSKIDPTTGFVNLFDTRYQNVEKAQTFFGNFENVRYNQGKNYFVFEVSNYALFNPKADETKQDWVICTHGNRIRTFRNPEQNNQWDNKEIVLTDEFRTLFEQYQIDCTVDLQDQIILQKDKTFFENLLYLFKLTLQMRNSITNSEVDYLISPVMNGNGKFYDSREADDSLPKDADANGAYHIAKKGLWVLEQISEYEGEDWKKLNLAISNREWLQFVQTGN